MIIKATFGRFEQEFENAGRSGSWTSDGLRALFDYLEANEPDHYEVDAVGLDCEYCEYDNAVGACQDLGIEFEFVTDEDGDDEDETERNALSALQRHVTLVICFDEGVIIRE